jgi:hypothetical protein
MVVLGFAILALVIPVVASVGKLAEAKGQVDTSAADVASWYARHGAVPDDIHDQITIEVDGNAEQVRVEALTVVTLVAVGGLRVEMAVRSEAIAPVSPYRSDR